MCPLPSSVFFPATKGGDHIDHISRRDVPRFDLRQHRDFYEQVKRPEHEHEWRRPWPSRSLHNLAARRDRALTAPMWSDQAERHAKIFRRRCRRCHYGWRSNLRQHRPSGRFVVQHRQGARSLAQRMVHERSVD